MIRSAEQLRVLLVADEYPPSICGIGDYTANLARALAAAGVEVSVLTKALADQPAQEKVDGVNIHRLARDWTAQDVRPICVSPAHSAAAIVHVQYPSLTNYHRRLMINLLPPLFRTVQRQYPLVVTVHGFHEHRLRWRLRQSSPCSGPPTLRLRSSARSGTSLTLVPFAASRSTLIPIASNVPAPPDAARRQHTRNELGFKPDDRVAV